jgi:hypothetical protein
MNQTSALSVKHHHGNGVLGQILLIRQISISGDKDLEQVLGQRKQLAVFDARPAHVLCRFDVVAGQVARQSPVQALV